jgi:ATP-binding cassette subfamily C (CFTR/MRP) protein 1
MNSGKSSLLLLLTRILDPCPSNAHITIDGLSIQDISRSAVQSRLLTIPQEPGFLPSDSSIMSNVDPFGDTLQAECEEVIKIVGLSDLVSARGGILCPLHPDTISPGQKQLFMIARAVLRARHQAKPFAANSAEAEKTCSTVNSEKSGLPGGVLLLDEVSSSVDSATDASIQRIIRTEFMGYTIVAVAHRKENIMDFDRVVLLEKGKIAKIGSPSEIFR